MKKGTILFGLLTLFLGAFSQPTEITVDGEWSAIYTTDCCGWTGGDGVYSIPLTDGRSVFVFGDTYLGNVNPDGSRSDTSPAVKNSIVVYDNGSIQTYYDGFGSKPDAYFQTLSDSSWFWPGHGFEYADTVYFFLSEFRAAGSGVFGFEWTGTSIARLPVNALSNAEPEIMQWPHGTDIHFGNAVMVDDGFVYAFGVRAFRVYIARTELGRLEWVYWDGTSWVEDPTVASALPGIYASEQFSVFKLGNEYFLLTQGAMLGREIYISTSSSVVAGWGKQRSVFDTPEPRTDSTLFTYNALAHPQFIEEDNLLVSYCVNSTDFFSIYRDVNRYRPRFLRVPLEILRSDQ